MAITITEHRTRLKSNTNAFEEHYPKARENFAKMFKGYPKKIRLQMADLVFDAQGRKPLFYYLGSDELPHAWNDPKKLKLKTGYLHTWDDCDFYRYEIGHHNPRNAGGKDEPENLCFMSGRCNQHIQASLPLEVVMNDLFPHNKEVQDRVKSLKKLYQSTAWKKLKESSL